MELYALSTPVEAEVEVYKLTSTWSIEWRKEVRK